jgi:O-antigen biosynthesis protein
MSRRSRSSSSEAPATHPAAIPTAAPIGTVSLGILLDRDAMLVVGASPTAPPASADAAFGTSITGAWRALSWQGEDGTHRFVAILWGENIVRAHTMETVLRAGEGQSFALPEFERIEVDIAPLIPQLKEAGADLAAVFDFLRRALSAPPVGGSSARARRFLFGFLNSISSHDGFLEIIGRPEGVGVMLQGWSVHLQSGPSDLILVGASFDMEHAVVARFDRTDTLATARGILAYARNGKTELKGIQRVYFRSGAAYYHLDITEDRLVLDEPEAVAHLKDMLGKIDADPVTLQTLKRMCRTRYPGHETVSTLKAPLRLAYDVALHADGSGIFVSGWLLDPTRLAAMVSLRSTAGFQARMDDRWTRLPRRDVSDGYATDPLFAGRMKPDDVRHGFLVFVPRPTRLEPGETHYLEVVLQDESSVFLPVLFDTADPTDTLRRILSSINVDEPTVESIIAAHVGPIATALSADRATIPASTARVAFGTPVAKPQVTVIVPLTAPRPDFDVNLARFGGDADFRRAELMVVAPRTIADPVASLLRKSGPFYGLSGALAIADTAVDYFEALQLGARAASSELLLFLSPNVLPSGRGWLTRLIDALKRAPGPGLVSPTLLYEDDSLRFAGSKAPASADLAMAASSYAGYSRHWIKAAELSAVWAGTAECALIPRGLFLGSGGFSRELIGAELKNVDFALRLGTHGSASYWAPDISLYALDDGSVTQDDEYWAKVGRLVDRWEFGRKWSTVLAAAAKQEKTRLQ